MFNFFTNNLGGFTCNSRENPLQRTPKVESVDNVSGCYKEYKHDKVDRASENGHELVPSKDDEKCDKPHWNLGGSGHDRSLSLKVEGIGFSLESVCDIELFGFTQDGEGSMVVKIFGGFHCQIIILRRVNFCKKRY